MVICSNVFGIDMCKKCCGKQKKGQCSIHTNSKVIEKKGKTIFPPKIPAKIFYFPITIKLSDLR